MPERTSRWPRVIAALAAIILLSMILSQAINLVMAGIYNHQTEQYLSFWSEQQKKARDDFMIRPKALEVALRGADKGIGLLPDSAEQQVLKARLLTWAEQYPGAIKETLDKELLLPTWQKAISLRPSWPYSWSEYAMAMAQRSFIDEKFEQALIRANRLGPWERDVMETSTILGQHYKGWLSPELTITLEESGERLHALYPRVARRLGVK